MRLNIAQHSRDRDCDLSTVGGSGVTPGLLAFKEPSKERVIWRERSKRERARWHFQAQAACHPPATPGKKTSHFFCPPAVVGVGGSTTF